MVRYVTCCDDEGVCRDEDGVVVVFGEVALGVRSTVAGACGAESHAVVVDEAAGSGEEPCLSALVEAWEGPVGDYCTKVRSSVSLLVGSN